MRMRRPSMGAAAILAVALAIPLAAHVPLHLAATSSRSGQSATGTKDPSGGPAVEFVLGTATPSEACAQCHEAIYREVAFGFESDLQFKPIINQSLDEPL